MTGFLYKRHRIWFRAIATVVVCLFFINNLSYGVEVLQDKINGNNVSAPSRFNYIYGDNFTMLRDVSGRTALEEALQNDVSLVYTSHLIGKILSGWGSIMSEKPIRALIGKHLSRVGHTNINWQGLYKEGKTFCLPYVDSEGQKAILRYYLPEDKPSETKNKESIAIESGKARVIVESEPRARTILKEFILNSLQEQAETTLPIIPIKTLQLIDKLLSKIGEVYGWDLLDSVITTDNLSANDLLELEDRLIDVFSSGLLHGNPLYINFLEHHTFNTAGMNGALAEGLGYDERTVVLKRVEGFAHDFGKALNPENLDVHNSTKSKYNMTDDERQRMHDHAKDSFVVLRQAGIRLPVEAVLSCAINHRADWTEKTPEWKKQIRAINPSFAKRINLLTIADSFCAIIEPRSYTRNVAVRSKRDVKEGFLEFEKIQGVVDEAMIEELLPFLTSKMLHTQGSALEAYELIMDDPYELVVDRKTKEYKAFDASKYRWAREKATQTVFSHEAIQREIDYLLSLEIIERVHSGEEKYILSERFRELDIYETMIVRYMLRPLVGKKGQKTIHKVKEKIDEYIRAEEEEASEEEAD